MPRGATSETNYSCKDETTITMINGGCKGLSEGIPPHSPYNGAQLTAAVSFIKAHAGQVSPVTLVIGAADVLPDIITPTCQTSSSFLVDSLTAASNISNTILPQLHAALNGTGDLVIMNYFDPYQNECPNLDPLAGVFNTLIQDAAVANGAFYADVYTAFGGSHIPNPNLCNYTWICHSPPDVDPTTQGYSVIASAFQSTLKYATLTANRSTANVGSTITMTGTNYAANEQVKVYWISISATPLATVTASASGSFTTSIKVPAATYGTHNIIAKGQTSGQQASVPVQVQPKISLFPSSGSSGTHVTVSCTGYKASEAVTVRWMTSTGTALGSVKTSTSGAATVNIVVPSSTPGSYQVYGVGSSSGDTAHATFTVH
jgi:hypothetical protein